MSVIFQPCSGLLPTGAILAKSNHLKLASNLTTFLTGSSSLLPKRTDE